MNPDSELGSWMRVCLELNDEQTDVEAAGIHLEVDDAET